MTSMSTVWDRTTDFLSDRLSIVAAIALPAVFVPNAVQGIVQPLSPTAGPFGQLGLSILTVALTLVGVWGQTALIALALEPMLTRGAAFRQATSRFGAAIGVALLLLLALAALTIPVWAILVGYGVDLAALADGAKPDVPTAAGLWIALYTIVVLPVVIWLWARLLPVSAVVVAERRGAGAIRRAFALTDGLAGRIVGVAILFLIVVLVATLAAKTVFGSILRLVFGDVGAINAASVVTAIVVALVSTIFSAIGCAFAAKLYLALRDREDARIADTARSAPA